LPDRVARDKAAVAAAITEPWSATGSGQGITRGRWRRGRKTMGDRIDLARFAVVLIPIVGFWIAAQAKNRKRAPSTAIGATQGGGRT
jgi:hypothetical protein